MELEHALPPRFSFYELGEILPAPENTVAALAPEALIDCAAISIRFEGDVAGSLLLILDRGLDLDIYSEVANVIASRFVGALASSRETDVMITPPTVLSETQIARIPALAAAPGTFTRDYRHLLRDGRSVPLQILVVPAPPRGGARA